MLVFTRKRPKYYCFSTAEADHIILMGDCPAGDKELYLRSLVRVLEALSRQAGLKEVSYLLPKEVSNVVKNIIHSRCRHV
jgi:hypothetical protein